MILYSKLIECTKLIKLSIYFYSSLLVFMLKRSKQKQIKMQHLKKNNCVVTFIINVVYNTFIIKINIILIMIPY